MKGRNVIIISIISSLLFGIIIYILFKPVYYTLEVNADNDYATGILVKDLIHGSFYLNVDFDNPYDYCSVGIFVYEGDSNNLRLLSASGTINEDKNCSANLTSSGYEITNKTFTSREYNANNGSIIKQMVKNKDNTYLCITKNSIYSKVSLDDCYKIEIKRNF